jgi:alkanesulfonate monooxygenase SsuD/methylene tetrahydromethanopterin reductase-like flavin-dependent oxidoreductase (luciferase family)
MMGHEHETPGGLPAMTTPTEATRGFAILRGDVTDAASTAAAAERLGYHAAWSPEFYTRSAIVSLAAMAQVTSTARIGSSIAYAVGRTPLVLATEARSLDELSHGRLIYGLGTGTTKMMAGWHGVDPSGPASRMEELIPLSIRASRSSRSVGVNFHLNGWAVAL